MSVGRTCRRIATTLTTAAAALLSATGPVFAARSADAPAYPIQSLVAVVMCLVILVIAAKRFGRT